MPWHQDAIQRIVNGKLPQRAISAEGDRLQGGTYGLLWLPPIDPDAALNGAVGCAMTYDDGTPTLEPPQDLLELLTGA
jgi:hypothetical protein